MFLIINGGANIYLHPGCGIPWRDSGECNGPFRKLFFGVICPKFNESVHISKCLKEGIPRWINSCGSSVPNDYADNPGNFRHMYSRFYDGLMKPMLCRRTSMNLNSTYVMPRTYFYRYEKPLMNSDVQIWSTPGGEGIQRMWHIEASSIPIVSQLTALTTNRLLTCQKATPDLAKHTTTYDVI